MLHRTLFAAVSLFFIIMNVLLWTSEISGRDQPGSPVPIGLVWQKIITAPDHSALEIQKHSKKIGYSRWSPNVGAEIATGRRMEEGPPPEGMVREVTGYSIDFDGGVTLQDSARLRFDFQLRLDTNHVWKEFHLRLNLRPTLYTLHSENNGAGVTLTLEEEGRTVTHLITPDLLQDPDGLLGRLGGPLLPQLIRAGGLSFPHVPARDGTATNALHNLSLGLNWTCRNDWLRLGHSRLRVYRVEAALLDRFRIVVYVSPVGEIFRVELPDATVLVNEALSL